MSSNPAIQTIQTLPVAVANPKIGEVILTPPRKAKPGEPPPPVICWSITHDRPRIALVKKNPEDDQEYADVGALFDKEPSKFFADGKCPCTAARPKPISEEFRKKQIQRVAQRFPLFYTAVATEEQQRPKHKLGGVPPKP